MRKTVTDFAARLGVLAIAVALSQLWFANNAAAQTLRFKASRDVITAPVNYSGSIVVTNLVTVSGIGGNTVSLSVSGLPSGVTASLTDQGGNAEPTTAQSTNLWITLSFSGSVADGIYTFSLNASGLDTNSAPVNNSLPFTLEVGSVWNGPANVAANGQSDWSDATKWLPNTLAPGSGADVVIGDVGCQTNPIINGALTPNIVVSADTTVSSIRFAQTNAVQYQSVLIGGGHTLTVNGAGGFSIQRDYIADSGYGNVTPQINVTFAGTNGATLAVNNESANFSILDDTSGNNQRSTYDFSPLDYLTTDVSRMALGDYTAFPNYMTYSIGNSYNGVPRRFLPNINLAKTNVIKAVFADPYNYTNGINRQYSLSYLNTEQAGTSTQPTLMLGISNMFLVDSVNFVGANQQGNVQFNRSLLIYTNAIVGVSTNYYTNSMVAYFRNPTNGPLSVFSISDAGGTNGANSNVKATIDLSLGTVDILADRFFISRDRPRVNSGQNPNYQGTFIMGAGTVNVNTAILGYQEYSDQTNEVTFNGYCEGTVTIQSNGLFQVNNDLILGYGTQTNALGLGSGGNTTYGKLNILNGGTLAANKIEVGIPAFTSMNNYIIVSNAATLIVSNTIASTNKMLDSLKFDNATLSLNVDGTSTTPLVYATNLVTVGNNTVNIMSIANPGSVAIPLIRYVVPGASFSTLTMPGGYVGALIDDGVGTIYLNVLTNAPKNLVWRGYSSSSWDLTTKNWLDTGTGLQTNFANGDNVAFDDASGIPTSINLAASTIIVGAMTVTNSANAYTFAGSGNVVGSLVKTGTNSLEIDGPTSLNVEIDSGSFTGLSGSSVGQVTILAGAQMNFAGNIKGGVTCAGTGTISGNVVGGLTLQSGGVFTNRGTFNSTFNTSENTLLVNELNASFNNFGSSTVATNSTLINRGYLGGSSSGTAGLNLTINSGGTFEDTGEGWLTMNGTLTISSSATFIPGGNGVGTTFVYKGTATGFPARVLLALGSTNVFKVNKDLGQNTQLQADFVDYGGSSSTRNYNGCTLQFVNIGTTPFAAGDSFTIAKYSETGGAFPKYTGTATNTYPVMDPPAPLDGLAWNINNLTLSGVVNIQGVSTNTFNIGFNPMVSTLVTTNSTNQIIVGNLSWPGTNTGWRLQQLSTALTNGLSATNWTDVFGSAWTNAMVLTNNVTTNSAMFYRMVYP